MGGSTGEIGSNLCSYGVQASPKDSITTAAGLDTMCECKCFQGSLVVKSHCQNDHQLQMKHYPLFLKAPIQNPVVSSFFFFFLF